MLQHLYIKNYALISELDLDLHEGFSVITGETGAGKSILLGAIGLLLGQRAEAKTIKAGETRCVIEATLDLSQRHLDAFFAEADLDFDGTTCIIRRELTAAGKSRAFINDTPATVATLRALGEQIIDIHSQHKNLLLSTEDFQLSLLDILADDRQDLHIYKEAFRVYNEARRTLQRLTSEAKKAKEDEDYLSFQLQQLDELDPQEGEDEALEKEQSLLEHAEDIKAALWGATNVLSSDDGLIEKLDQTMGELENIAEVYAPAEALAQRLESVLIELKDIASEVADGAEEVEFDPARLNFVCERLNAIFTLEQKHQANTVAELIALRKSLAQRIEAITNSDEHIAQAESAMKEAYAKVCRLAQGLSARRKESARSLEKEMVARLQTLGMPNVSFMVDIQPRKEPDASGLDKVEFLFSANKNGRPEPIATIASGGEIARVMLSLKALISKATSLPTIIFDEIDTGVSGQIADRMAETMREMATRDGAQVISITHLPQIAAAGAHHYRVYKQDNETTTESHITELDASGRVEELAHMLSGATLTPAALENAKALLSHKA